MMVDKWYNFLMKFIAKKLVSFVEFIERILPRVHIYHIEDVFVALVLIGATWGSGNSYIEWIGALAAFISYKHIVISFRLQEIIEKEESENIDKEEASHLREAGRQSKYFYGKESLWFLYFVLLGGWSGVISVIVFLLYPVWHTFRIKYHKGTKHLQSKKYQRKTRLN